MHHAIRTTYRQRTRGNPCRIRARNGMHRNCHPSRHEQRLTQRSHKIRKSNVYILILPSLVALLAYRTWKYWLHTGDISNTRRLACFVTGCALVTVSMTCWAFHFRPRFGYPEFLVFIFWPVNFGMFVGLLVPLRFTFCLL